ncbi:MAG: ABC transporter ATP-binding protein [Planctomycetota bacterium]|nr:ABC transporter ATP-binding protein [Planctomycetota bacterium]
MQWHGAGDDDDQQERQFTNYQVFRRLTPLFHSQRRAILQSFALLIIVTSCSLAGPQLLRLVINEASKKDGSEANVITLSLIFVVISVLGFALNYLMTLIVSRSGLEIVTDLKERLFRHILQLKVSFFHDYTPGRLLSRCESDSENLKQLFSHAAVRLASSLFMFFGVIGVMLYEDWQSTGVILLGLPVIGVMLIVAMRVIRRYYKRSRKISAKISSFIAEYVPGISTIQHYQYEEKAKDKLEGLNSELVRARVVGEILSYTFWGVFHFFEIMAVAAVIAVAAPKVARGELDLGTLIMFIEYLRQVFMPLMQISEFVNFVQRAFVSAERVFALFSLEPDDDRFSQVSAAEEAHLVPAFQDKISFNDVTFSYREGDNVLHGVSFDIHAGETVAVVGASGGGKTTLANLLLAFYEPVSGSITVDGKDLKSFPKRAWRKKIGLVLQELQLFPGTVRDNLTVFANDLPDDALWRALEISKATGLVEGLGGLDATLGERGNNLSQGERQLISFARSLVHNPPLLVLDEATASVDPITERNIQLGFDQMLKSRAAFIIAHRLSTIIGADRILVVENGRIVASGTHEELLAEENSAYQHLYELQFGQES